MAIGNTSVYGMDSGNLVVKQWSKDFFKYGLSKMFFSRFVGKYGQAFDPAMGDKRVTIMSDPNALIQVKMDLSRTMGDTITFPMLAPLEGNGRAQRATATDAGSLQHTMRALEGNEEIIQAYSWSTTLLEWAHSVRTIGKLMERQPAFSVSDSMTAALGLWYAKALDQATYQAMAGITMEDDGGTVQIVTGTAPSRKLTGGCKEGTVTYRTTDAAIDAKEYMCFEMIDYARQLAETDSSNNTIRPIIIDGQETYFMFMSAQQATDLRNDAGGSVNLTWKEAQMHANTRGRSNPIFRNFMGFYRDVALFEYPRIDVIGSRTGDGSTENLEKDGNSFEANDNFTTSVIGHRALFCGAQAAVHAYGSMPIMVDETFEYKTQKGKSLQTIMAIGRPEFNSVDYGVMAVDTAVTS